MEHDPIKESAIQGILDKTKRLLDLPVEQFVREKELGTQNYFKELEYPYKNLLKKCELLNRETLFQCTTKQTLSIDTHFNSILKKFNQILDYKAIEIGLTDKKNQLAREFISLVDQLVEILVPVEINYLRIIIEGSKQNTFLDEAKQKRDEIDGVLQEITKILDTAKQVSGQIGVSSYATIFKDQAEEHETESEKWLIASIVMAGILLIVTLLFLFKPFEVKSDYELIQISVAKIILFAILFFGLSFCVKGYRAHRHNNIINKHRQNALDSFDAFSKAASSDSQTQNAVLLEATHTIFSNQQSGYVVDDKENDSPKILEIVKSISTKE